jgi:uncharacterized protein (TIGR03435 family)
MVKLNRRKSMLLGRPLLMPVVFAMVLVTQVQAQTEAAISAANPTEFDVATIKPSDPNLVADRVGLDRDEFMATGQTAKWLIKFAYNRSFGSDQQIAEGPSWIASAKFDVVAKENDETIAKMRGLTVEQQMAMIRPMVQALLADRFQLKVHHETKELPVYALVVTKGGIKMKPSEDSAIFSPNPEEARGHSFAMRGRGQLQGGGATTEELSNMLSIQHEVTGRMVVNKTGLTGKYDFMLRWTPDTGSTMANGSTSPDSSEPSLFTAIQEQLGLKLETQKSPVDVIVIDAIEKPSPN